MQEPLPNTNTLPSISFSGMLLMFFDGLIKFVRHILIFLIKYKWILLIGFIVGSVIGYIRYKTSKPVYKITMIVKSTELNATTLGQMVNNLDQLSQNHTDSIFASELKLNKTQSNNLIGLKATNIFGEDLLKDTSQAINRNYVIEMFVHENSLADTLQRAVLNYFNDNIYLNKRKQDKIKLAVEKIRFLNSEITKLDSLKNEYNKFLSSGKNAGMFYNNAFNPVELYQKSSEFYTEKSVLEEWLEQGSKSIVMIDGVKPAAVPQSLTLVQQMFLYGLVVFFLGILVIGLTNIARNK